MKKTRNELSKLQAISDRYIELVRYHKFDIFCNENGKLDGLMLNRPLYDEDGKRSKSWLETSL